MRNRRSIYALLSLLVAVGFYLYENYNPQSVTIVSIEGFNYLPTSTTGQIIQHKNYSLSYNELYEQAEWVAYELNNLHLTYDDRKRPYFINDPKVITGSANYKNYKKSGYDRGHLCPAGDRRYTKEAYDETFFTSNITPQRNNFNAGVWNRLEIKQGIGQKNTSAYILLLEEFLIKTYLQLAMKMLLFLSISTKLF